MSRFTCLAEVEEAVLIDKPAHVRVETQHLGALSPRVRFPAVSAMPSTPAREDELATCTLHSLPCRHLQPNLLRWVCLRGGGS
jgi:hypothetical protein